MLLRNKNPIGTLISLLTCFGLALWFAHVSSFHNDSANPTPILRADANYSTAATNYRRNAEPLLVNPIITVANYFVNTTGFNNSLFAYADVESEQVNWFLYIKASIPARADPCRKFA